MRDAVSVEGSFSYLGTDVWHPLLAIDEDQLPSFDELVARSCAEARELLWTTRRLAASRLDVQDQLRACIEQLEAVPWGQAGIGWRTPATGIIVSDVLRGLLVCVTAMVRSTLMEDSVGADFNEAVERWRRRCASEPEDPTEPTDRAGHELELSLDLRRRWAVALAGVEAGATPITGLEIAAQLQPHELESLAALENRYCEGLVTMGESAARIWSNLHAAGPHALPRYQPTHAYLDRHGGLAALDEALARGPGALVVGAQGTGRHALINAWRRRLAAGHGPEALSGWRVFEDPSPDTAARCRIEVHTPRMLDGRIEANSPFHLELCEILERAREPVNQRRVVLILDDITLTPLRRLLPEIDTLSTIRVPVIREHELAPMWVCQVPEHDSDVEPLYLLQLLRSIGRRPSQERANFSLRSDIAATNNPTPARCRSLAKKAPEQRLAVIHRTFHGRALVPNLNTLAALEDLHRALSPGS